MQTLAVTVLTWCALAYFVLGGADIGAGIALPYLGRDAAQRRIVVAAVAPFFLGNEVWLVATVGVLAGGFPSLEARLLHALLPGLVPLLAGWVVRDSGLWLRGRVELRGWSLACDGAITAGSAAVAASWGWILACLLAGSVDAFATGLGALLGAACGLVLFGAHGLAFAGLRLTGTLRARARAVTGRTGETASFALTTGAVAAVVLAAGVRLAPATAAADPATLRLLVPALLVVLPVTVAAQAGVWRLFRHRVTGPSYL